MPILQVIKLSVTHELEGGERANVRDYLFFFIDKTQLPDGFLDSPSYDGSYYAVFLTSEGVNRARCIMALSVLSTLVPFVLNVSASRAVNWASI